MAKIIVQVCIPNSFKDYYDYYANDVAPVIGARVLVPFRNKVRLGIVVNLLASDDQHYAVKSIEKILDTTPFLSGESLALGYWVSKYYQTSLSEVMPLLLTKRDREGKPLRKPPAKSMLENDNQFISDNDEPITLKSEQIVAINKIKNYLNEYKGFLLQGVTGSGKTEVYFQVIDAVLKLGRQVLVIVPEIGLTPQLLSRFSARFDIPMVVIHSKLNDGDRQRAWHSAKNEAAKIIIGTRAAIFTPIPNLGLIVIDEEHDASLKQMDTVRYSARDTALMRAKLRHIPIVLGTATPSLESLHNCQIGKYIKLNLSEKALNDFPLHYQVLDIRNQILQQGLAPLSLTTIQRHLEQKNQILVFINRRGFAPVIWCNQCHWISDCKACDAHLTWHKTKNKLICHHCGLVENFPAACPKCHEAKLIPIGMGTQRVYEYLEKAFPQHQILRIDRDQTIKKEQFENYLNLIQAGKADIIVGTQMLAKGHHFPRLSLVVIVDADNGFYNQDFRALERLGQLLTQVAGRAGRADKPGQVIIQTNFPHHPLLNLLIQQGYEVFANALLKQRYKSQLPPYHYLSIIRAQGKNISELIEFLNVAKTRLHQAGVNCLGPAPAPLARKGGYHCLQLLVKSNVRKTLNLSLTEVREWLTSNKFGTKLRWSLDVDPIELA